MMLNIGMLKQTVAFLKIVSSVAGFILVREYAKTSKSFTNKPNYRQSNFKQVAYTGKRKW